LSSLTISFHIFFLGWGLLLLCLSWWWFCIIKKKLFRDFIQSLREVEGKKIKRALHPLFINNEWMKPNVHHKPYENNVIWLPASHSRIRIYVTSWTLRRRKKLFIYISNILSLRIKIFLSYLAPQNIKHIIYINKKYNTSWAPKNAYMHEIDMNM
jgi:hypothetical protein